jgi:hypothetical protein
MSNNCYEFFSDFVSQAYIIIVNLLEAKKHSLCYQKKTFIIFYRGTTVLPPPLI